MTRKVRAGRIPNIYVGGVLMEAGKYLPSESSVLVDKRPDKDEGYAHYDGETLTLRNYSYTGPGRSLGNMHIGIDVSNANTEIVFRGENCININVEGSAMNVALLVNDGKAMISGKGELALYAEGSTRCNFGVLGSGTLKITSGTTRLHATVGNYIVDDEGKRIYEADSYAMKMEKFSAPLARIRGRDDVKEDEHGKRRPEEKNESGEMNRNNETEVIIDFPKMIFWWWRKGCLTQALLILLALLLGTWVFLRDPEILEPDFALLEVDPNAEEMEDDGGEASSTAGGGSVVLNYTYDVSVNLSSKKVELYFGLPSRSNRDAVLQLVVGDTLLAQSGRLPPGYQVSRLTLREDAAKRLKKGGYKGELRVLYYNDETGERAILDTKIEVDIAVTN